MEAVEEAVFENDPKKVFEKVSVHDIRNKMSQAFNPPPELSYAQRYGEQGRPNSRNHLAVFESFDCQALIFSYRLVDFEGLYNFMANRLNDPSAESKEESTTPRQFDRPDLISRP